MARLPALIDALAQYDGRGRPTLEHMARLIREAGYIQTTKRGRGAAEMTEEDAVALLIGVNATEDPGKVADAVRVFSELRRGPSIVREADDATSDILTDIVEERRFASALATLLRKFPLIQQLAISSNEAYREMSKGQKAESLERAVRRGRGFSLHVSFSHPVPVARIVMNWTIEGASTQDRYVTLLYQPKENLPRRVSRFIEKADRTITVSVGLKYLGSIHEALWPPVPKSS